MDATVLYCVVNGRESYVGITRRLPRRLREHSGEVVGGARRTTMIKRRNKRPWRLRFVVSGLGKRRHAGQLEWRLHRKYRGARRTPFGDDGGAHRAWQLYAALQMERVTATAPVTAELPVEIAWHSAADYEVARALPAWPPLTKHSFVPV